MAMLVSFLHAGTLRINSGASASIQGQVQGDLEGQGSSVVVGSGSVSGMTTVDGAFKISPSPGTFSFGDVTIGGTGAVELTVNSNGSAGTNFDQIQVTGSVAISTGATLNLIGTGGVEVGNSVVIISNDGIDPINGAFSNLSEGTIFTLPNSGTTAQISYQGGDGNDVEITAIDLTIPVITLLGSSPVAHEAGTVYTDPGATAEDAFDGNLTNSIAIQNSVIVGALGSYTVTYNVTDPWGNTAPTVTRTVNVSDTISPVISLVGSSTIQLEAGTAYSELGYNAVDSFEGVLTGNVSVTSDVDSNKIGDYTVTYNVSDGSGNAATQVTRSVEVRDTLIPEITLLGSSSITHEAGTAYTDAGATSVDSFEGNLTGSMLIQNSVDPSALGSYTVTYNVSDSSENQAAEVIRSVQVTDTISPAIVLSGGSTIQLEAGATYAEPGFSSSDSFEGDLTSSVTVDSSSVNSDAIGDYTVTYNVSDDSGNAAPQMTRTVQVEDTTIPEIILLGDATMQLEAGTSYIEPGFSATDSFEGDLSSSVNIESDVDSNKIGDYTVNYTVEDSSGNDAVEVTRVVQVRDTVSPVITLLGENPLFHEAGTVYNDSGATASDAFQGDLTASIKANNQVDVSALGDYTVTYNVEDGAGNTATEVVRSVLVRDSIAPVITLLGDLSIQIEAGTQYIEPGFMAIDSFEGDLTAFVSTNPNIVNGDLVGEYRISYKLLDSSKNASETLTRIVNVVDSTPPVAANVSLSTAFNESVSFDVTDFASDPEGSALTAQTSNVLVGSASVENGIVTYMPSSSFSGQTSFTYTVFNEYGASASGNVSVTVGDPPPPEITELEILESSIKITLTGVANQLYTIQESTDLATWKDIAVIIMPSNGETDYIRNAPPESPVFYRLSYIEGGKPTK